MRRGLGIALALGLAAPLGLAADHLTPRAPISALTVELGGCAQIAAPLRCEADPGATLSLWVAMSAAPADGGALAPAPGPPRVLIDGAPLRDAGEAMQGGTRFRVALPAGARAITIEAGRGSGRASFTLPIARVSQAPEIVEAEKLRKTKPAEAEALVAPLLRSPDARARADAAGIVARIRLASGKANEALPALLDAARAHRDAGWPSEALKDALAAAHTAFYQARDLAAAREALDLARDLTARMPFGAERVRYHEGLLARETGDLRGAWRSLQEASDRAERVGNGPTRSAASQALAFVAQALGGRAEGERRLVAAAEGASADACASADAWANLGWFWAREEGAAERARDALKKSLDLRQNCANTSAEVSTWTDLAWVLAAEGRAVDAEAALREASKKQADPAPRTRVVWLDVEGQLALRAGDAGRALAAYETLGRIAAAGLLAEAAWRSALGRARALAALVRDAEAAVMFDAAEARVASAALSVPAGDERGGFLDRFAESAKSAVEHFAARDPAKAARIARRAIGRMLASLEWQDRVAGLDPGRRARWEAAIDRYRRERAALEAEAGTYWRASQEALEGLLAARRAKEDALQADLDAAMGEIAGARSGGEPTFPAPAAGELRLTFFRGETTWLGFATTAETTRAARLQAPSSEAPDARASAWLAPFDAEISAAKRLVIAAPGALAGIDFHALPFRGAPLLATVPVAYAAELGRGARHDPAGDLRALVVADTNDDLPNARAEAAIVISGLGSRDAAITPLVGQDATRDRVLRALEQPLGVLHVAGHGRFRADRLWDSGIPLAGGGALTLGDIVTLGRAPAIVVLSGCETAAANEREGARSLGVGQAFVAAGATAVVAAARPVDDALAAAISGALYKDLRIGDDMSARLQAAVMSVRDKTPAADWAAFRVLVP